MSTVASTLGFQAAPIAVVGGPNNINACLLGSNGDGVVVAFRGTLVPDIHDLASLLDWLQDFDAVPMNVDSIPGKVHMGFWRGLATIWDKLLAAVGPLLAAAGGNLPLYLTGHSKGGGLAQLAAMRFRVAGITPQGVYTYASPRAGDREFATAYDAALIGVRYEYTDDVVPHMPPTPSLINRLQQLPLIGNHFREVPVWDYVSAGTLRFIDWNMQVVGESSALENERFLHLARLIGLGQFKQIVADHDHSCGGGYMSQVCPGVCPGS